MVRDGLTSRGARVDVAASGEEALCLLESRGYDLVLCDLNLKAMVPSAISGQELYARATRLPWVSADRAPVFVFMTGELADQTATEDSSGERVRTLQKPFRVSDLAKILAEVLAEASSRDPQPTSAA